MTKLKEINWKIPLYKVSNNSDEIRAVSNVIKRGMNWAIGPEIEEFEKELAKYIWKMIDADSLNIDKLILSRMHA